MVDLPTADYITNVQVENATIVGQFEGGTPRVLQRRPRQGQHADAVHRRRHRFADRADGTLDKLASTWLPFQDSVPVIKP